MVIFHGYVSHNQRVNGGNTAKSAVDPCGSSYGLQRKGVAVGVVFVLQAFRQECLVPPVLKKGSEINWEMATYLVMYNDKWNITRYTLWLFNIAMDNPL